MSQVEFEFLGPYKIEAVLGRGGMGTVYKGTHVRSGDKVAIKVIATGVATQSRFRRRFAGEVETLKRLKHPHIVQLIGYGEEHGLLFYSMEYVDGHSLHDHLRQHRTLPWEDALQVGIETAAALKHAHDLGIIHRDLKPANLMLNSKGQIKLTDFGIAKLFGSTDMTAAGSVIGTADYMPPEQAEGKPVTSRSDLYSLGCVLFALMAGRPPFGGKSVPEVLYAVRYNPVPKLTDVVPGCPTELALLVEELLDKDPQQRPPTALVVGNRLKAIQQGMQKLASANEGKPKPVLPDPNIGQELTSLDLSDSEDEELRLTNPDGSSLRDDPTMLAPQQADSPSYVTDQDRTSDATEPPPPSQIEVPLVNTLPVARPPVSADRAWSATSRLSEDEHQLSSGGPSHFTHVTDADGKLSPFGVTEPVHSHRLDWLQYASMAGMLLILLICLGIGWRILQPKSADALYRDIAAAVESVDDGQLIEALPAVHDFLERFPDDPRAAELRSILDDAELTKEIRKLQRQANRAGGVAELTAIEQGFLDCMSARNRDYDLYRVKLQAFLSVFGKIETLSAKEMRMVELASFARHEPVVKTAISPATQQLEKLIRSAEGVLKGKELDEFYQSLLVLYDGKDWAVEQLARIRERIKTSAMNASP